MAKVEDFFMTIASGSSCRLMNWFVVDATGMRKLRCVIYSYLTSNMTNCQRFLDRIASGNQQL